MTAPNGYSVHNLAEFVGHDFGASEPIEITQPMINSFAEITNDHQWIHVDIERSKAESPFGGPVAHGFLSLSLLTAGVNSAGVIPEDASGAINYGLDTVRFLAPVPANSRVTANLKLIGVEDKRPKGQLLRLEAVLRVEGSDRPAVSGEMLALVMG